MPDVSGWQVLHAIRQVLRVIGGGGISLVLCDYATAKRPASLRT
jgi:hypothetical protein